jgi:adenine-specific DNA-methyltransferase
VLAGSGLELSAAIAVEPIDGREAFVVAGGELIACLAKDISPSVVREIAHRGPSRAVFLDSAFATDADRVGARRVFAATSPATDLRVI